MTAQALLLWLEQRGAQKIKFAFADIDGILRGKIISIEKLKDALQHDTGFCDVVFGWDSQDTLYSTDIKVTGWHTGFPDALCRLDTATLREIPWQDNMPLLLADFPTVAACPRNLLKQVAKQATDMGFTARFAQEFEWFNFAETPQSLADKNHQQPKPVTPGMFGYSVLRPSQLIDYNNALFDELTAFNIPIEGLHTETGPGVYEAAIAHDEVLAAADKAVLFKAGVKEIASRFGIMASFMAKWNQQLPGCSGHVHQSLWNEHGENLFADAAKERGISKLLEHYVAGQLLCLPHIMPMYAPTINSYKRLVEGAWAPTTVSWGYDNRTAAIRVLHPYAKATRVETRIPGSDSNPYLAMAAALASGLYGIKHQIPLRLAATTGNAYAQESNLPLHSNLADATYAMQQSALANELLGEAFVQHFTATRIHEWKQYSDTVTDWELRRYFEII